MGWLLLVVPATAAVRVAGTAEMPESGTPGAAGPDTPAGELVPVSARTAGVRRTTAVERTGEVGRAEPPGGRR